MALGCFFSPQSIMYIKGTSFGPVGKKCRVSPSSAAGFPEAGGFVEVAEDAREHIVQSAAFGVV